MQKTGYRLKFLKIIMKDWKDNVYFILVEPKEAGNIGASARAIKNMGFKNLCLVKPTHHALQEGGNGGLPDEARWLAHNALDVLEKAEIHDSLTEAIKDKSLIVGTTRRIGKKRGVILPVESGVDSLAEIAIANKVAILFGREDKGLYNEEIEDCGFLMTIPASSKQPSLNLAQAVLIIAYELSKAGFKRQKKESKEIPLISHNELSSFYARASEVLNLLEYIPRGDRNLEKKVMSNIKHLVGRTGLTVWELKMLHGICSQIKKKIQNDGKRP